MGQIIGPFSKDDFITMQQYKLDIEYAEKKLKSNPDYATAKKELIKRLKKYMNKAAA